MLLNKTGKFSALALLFALTLGLTSCTKKDAAPPAPPAGAPGQLPAAPAQPGAAPTLSAAAPDLTIDANGLSKATVTLATNKGVIKFKFFTKEAPATAARIVELVQKGFYNGLIFHRVENWVIQGGDPTGTGTGGSGQRLKAEFNARKHKEGTLGMARAQDPDSADSQFYITFGTQPHLDNNYTVFGQVIEGMDVVRKIQKGDTMTSVIVQ